MAIIAAFIKYWKIGLILAFASSVGIGYHLWTVNTGLRSDLAVEEQRNKVLREARVKDALAAKQFIDAMQAEQARLLAQLGQLGGIQDAEGRAYLDTAVPASVVGLFSP